MKMTVVGKTDAVIYLNKVGMPIKGKTIAVLNVTTPEQQAEVDSIIRAKLIEIVEEPKREAIIPQVTQPEQKDKKNTEDNPPKKRGRPKTSKLPEYDEQAAANKAEEITQKMGSRVVIATGKGGIVEGRMVTSAIDDIPAISNKTRASIEAMEQLNKEEESDFLFNDPLTTQPADAMGNKAIVSTEDGEKRVEMSNSILPGSNSIKNTDPFIDKSTKSDKKDTSIDSDDEDDVSDAFIKL